MAPSKQTKCGFFRPQEKTFLQQLKLPGYLVNFRGFIWPNGKTGSCRLTVKFGSTAVYYQMNFKSHFDGFVVNRHQLFFAVAADATFRKCAHNPSLRVGRKLIDANAAGMSS